MSSFQWVRADEVRAGDLVVVPDGGSSRAHFAPDVPPDGVAPRLVAKVDAPGSFVLEDGHVYSYRRRTPVLRLNGRADVQ